MAADHFPTPPYPDRENKLLQMIVETAARALETEKLDVHGALMYAAVHGWAEGHFEGEECPDGCFRDNRRHPADEPTPSTD